MADIQATFDIEDIPVEVARLREDVQPGQQFADVESVMQLPVAFDDPTAVTADTAEIDIATKFVPGYIAANIKQIQCFTAMKKAEIDAIDVNNTDVDILAKKKAGIKKVMDKIKRTRIDLKNIYLEPFEERIAKPLQAEYDSLNESLSPLEQKIIKAEEARIKAKKAEIDEALNERLAKESEVLDMFLHGCVWMTYEGNPAWLNKGTTMKKIIAEIDQKTLQAVNEITALGLFNTDNIHAPKMLSEYKQNGNLATALNLKNKLEAERQEYLRLEEERKAREAARAAELARQEEAERARRATYVPPVATPKPVEQPPVEHPVQVQEEETQGEIAVEVELPEVVVEEESEITITFTMTEKKGAALLAFLKANEIKYKVN